MTKRQDKAPAFFSIRCKFWRIFLLIIYEGGIILKKILTAFTAAALLLSGCSIGNESGSQSTVTESGEHQSSTPQNSTETQSSTAPDNSQAEPAGEKTFLIGADGLPIYTSEITEAMIFDTNSDLGEREIPVEELDESTFASATCSFAYVHDSRIIVSAAEAPDKFENGVYTGEELPPSAEYRRLHTGDRVGELTVRLAETYFTSEGEFAEYGSYLGWSSVYFDGELTITGYMSITENPLYQDGMVSLVPAESPLPQMFYQYAENVGISHAPVLGDGYYSEAAAFSLGYLEGINADMNGLKIGDTNVKVRAVIGNVRAGSGTLPMYFCDLLSVEIL